MLYLQFSLLGNLSSINIRLLIAQYTVFSQIYHLLLSDAQTSIPTFSSVEFMKNTIFFIRYKCISVIFACYII